jgi:hypothetical protein
MFGFVPSRPSFFVALPSETWQRRMGRIARHFSVGFSGIERRETLAWGGGREADAHAS